MAILYYKHLSVNITPHPSGQQISPLYFSIYRINEWCDEVPSSLKSKILLCFISCRVLKYWRSNDHKNTYLVYQVIYFSLEEKLAHYSILMLSSFYFIFFFLLMNENSIEVVRKLSLVGHSGEVLFYRGLRVLKGISDTIKGYKWH